jgi:tetratricopeptide (TPR) repeat protein
MQESGPVSPTDESPNQSPSTDPADVSGSAPGQSGSASKKKSTSTRRPQRPKRTSDPVIRWLAWGIAAVVVIWLVSMLSAMIFGLLTPPAAPRTAAERDLMSLTSTVKSGKANTQTYAQYVAVLISSGQLAKAQQSLDQAMKNAKTDKSYLYARQADLMLAKKDYPATIAAADKAIAEANKELKAFVAANKKANRKPYAGAVIPASYKDASLAKAEALTASGKSKDAIKSFDLYLEQSPTDSDILVLRAQVKIKVGDKKGAESDFRAALKYIPDYQPALDGLKQIGAAR